MYSRLLLKSWKTSFCVKTEDTWLHQRREKMLFAFKRLRNISLASLSAECQDTVCKQSVHVQLVTWRKLLSCCPRSLTPRGKPWHRYVQGQWRPSAVCHSRILSLRNYTSRCKTAHATCGRKKKKKSPQVIFGFANYGFICRIVKCLSVLHRGVALVAKLHKRCHCFSKIGNTSSG